MATGAETWSLSGSLTPVLINNYAIPTSQRDETRNH